MPPHGALLGERPVPDATGLELIAKELGVAAPDGGPVLETSTSAGAARCSSSRRTIRARARAAAHAGYSFLTSVHGVDYYPQEPRLASIYELLDMARVDRITVKVRVPLDAPRSTR